MQNGKRIFATSKQNHLHMKEVTIQSVADTENGSLFTICIKGEQYSEFEKFIRNHSLTYSHDLNIILTAIKRMLDTSGFLERYFRPEGKYRDHVCALPIQSGKLRLYCLRMNDSILIAGNGGVKDGKTYQECDKLNGYVVDLQKLDEAIKVAIKKGDIVIAERIFEGTDKPLQI